MMMILKMMTASWNLHWQMKIHLYYRGPAWAAEASQMLRNPLGRLQFLVHQPVFIIQCNPKPNFSQKGKVMINPSMHFQIFFLVLK